MLSLPPFPSLVVASFIVFCSVAALASQVPRLPPDETDGFWAVMGELQKTKWNFSVRPCTEGFDGSSNITDENYYPSVNKIICNCSYENGTVCHVTRIYLRAQSLAGRLPSQLVALPYLEELDLTRNYLTGEIPREWGSMKLVNISLLGNRLTGLIPDEIGNITTLRQLVLEMNQLSGSLPPALGNLLSLERLLLSSNNFTGELPASLGMLTSLIDFRISDNNFAGKIPTFIQNWVNIGKIQIQASGLSGPIPSEIGLLTDLTDLRISDLNGASSPFPSLNNLTKLKTLILRNCNITGVLPDNFDGMIILKILDLSFNKVSGHIPASFSSLVRVDAIFLTGNLLNGSVPDWMVHQGESIDLSYNKFTHSTATGCQSRNLNLFASSSLDNNSNLVSCFPNRTCARVESRLHINCGGKEETIEGVKFEGDENTGRSSQFFTSKTNWAFSNTGTFMDDDRTTDGYIARNSSALSMTNSTLYETARISPLSLTYYVYCMAIGNYTISLHFAEIMFTNDKNYGSHGRRIFDVYVQGKLVLKDFNIVDDAGGIGKAVIKKIPVSITSGTLEIRFYWAGKGTVAAPVRGVYGPLISAISVDPDSPSEGRNTLSVGAIVGISAAVAFIIILALGILWWRGYLGRKSAHQQDLKGQNLPIGSFTLKQIKAATNNFDTSNKIGEGGFGPVYKGILLDGTKIAVKQLSAKSKQGNREFVNEIGLISSLKHPHLVKLYGCCTEAHQLLLVYEYMENNSLAQALFGPQGCQLKLDWATRQKICIGVAKGLAFLHEESRLKIVHRDIKGSNVLLDKNINPKISDFGLAKLDEEENTHISTRVAGTFGYMAPEYATRGYLTDKADVYSFGIVALEIVSGRSNTIYRSKEKCLYLLDWALVLKEKDSLMELVDAKLGSSFNQEEAMTMINIAFLCTNASPTARPTMSSVVSMLEGKVAVKEFVPNPDDTVKEMSAMWTLIQQNEEIPDGENKTETASFLDMRSTNSSTSMNSRNWALEQHS